MTPRLVLPFLALALTLPAATAAPEGTAGPLVGSVTPDAAVVWFFAPEEADCAVRWHPADEASRQSTQQLDPVPDPAGLAPGRPLTAKLGGLAPDTRYEYAVAIDGSSDDDLRGSFRTPPAPGTPHKFRMVLTSCMKIGQPQDSWKLVLEQEPHFHLTVGDTHYADTTDPSIQWTHHLRYRRVPEFAAVLRQVPVYAMWDDHDYGPNDSDGTAPGKENSLAGWKQIWANPGAGTPETPGAFFKFSWGEIDFFVVDGRYHRSPDIDPDDENKRMLGDAQFGWLLDGLRNSTAKFKVVASGSTLNHSERDGWRIYTFARHRFFDAIREHRIPGVVYMSGDIHRSLVWEHPESERAGYPLVEVISSGIANSETRSFATIDFDTTLADPVMRVRTIFGDGTVVANRSWKLSELSPK